MYDNMYAYKHDGKKKAPGGRQREPDGGFNERRARQNTELIENKKQIRTGHAQRRYETATCLGINVGEVMLLRHEATAVWDNVGKTR